MSGSVRAGGHHHRRTERRGQNDLRSRVSAGKAGGHGIPEETIRRRFEKSMSYFESTYKSIVDEWYVWDSVDDGFALAQSWDKG